jgi:hypothetical protein
MSLNRFRLGLWMTVENLVDLVLRRKLVADNLKNCPQLEMNVSLVVGGFVKLTKG